MADICLVRWNILALHLFNHTTELRDSAELPDLRSPRLLSSTWLLEYARQRLASLPRFTTMLPGYKCEPLYYSWPDDPKGDVKKT